MPLKEYFMKIKQFVDALALFSKPISPNGHILVGLGSEYESMIFVISTRTNFPYIQDITTLLLTKEYRIECTISVEISLSLPNLTAQGLEKDINQPIKQQNSYQSKTNNQRGRGGGRSNCSGQFNRNKPLNAKFLPNLHQVWIYCCLLLHSLLTSLNNIRSIKLFPWFFSNAY